MNRRALALLAGAFLLALLGYDLLTAPRHSAPPDRPDHGSGLDVVGDAAAFRPPDPARPDVPALARAVRERRYAALDLTGTAVADADLAALEGLVELRGLYLDHTKVTDSGLAHLSGLTGLEVFRLAGTRVAGDGLAHLAPLAALEELTLPRAVGDDALPHVARLTNLRVLVLAGTRVTDEGLVHLAALRSLEHLDLTRTAVRGETLSRLAPCRKLEALVLESTAVGDDALAVLSSFPDLRRLDLRHARSVTGSTLRSLERLEHLDLSGAGAAAIPPGPFPALVRLAMAGTAVDDLGPLAGMPRLEALALASCPRLTEEDVAGLERVRTLRRLDLQATAIGDAALARLPALETLRLQGCATLTDAAVVHLSRVATLRDLVVPGQITDEALERLRAALPDARVDRTDVLEIGF